MKLGAELAPGLCAWTRNYEEWKDDVSSFAVERPEELVLIDPLLVGEDDWRALDELLGQRHLHVVLTVHWHARSSAEVLSRYPEARLWAQSRARAAIARRTPVTDTFAPGDPLPGGLTALLTRPRTEVVLWDPQAKALIAGDALVSDLDPPGHLRTCRAAWLPASTSLADLRASLRPTLDLPVELVLPSHGPAVLAEGLERLARALADPES